MSEELVKETTAVETGAAEAAVAVEDTPKKKKKLKHNVWMGRKNGCKVN